jgi:hypothetical protein
MKQRNGLDRNTFGTHTPGELADIVPLPGT